MTSKPDLDPVTRSWGNPGLIPKSWGDNADPECPGTWSQPASGSPYFDYRPVTTRKSEVPQP
jgi:hypothetical protein